MAKLPDGGVGLRLLRGLGLRWDLLGLGRGFFTRSFKVVRVRLLGLGLGPETAHCCASYNLLGLDRLIMYLLIMTNII